MSKLLTAEAKAKKAAYDKQWRAEHKERVNGYSRKYYAKKCAEKEILAMQAQMSSTPKA